MPSPLAHGAAGYLLRRTAARRRPGVRLTVAFVLLSFLPDLDALPGFLLHDLYSWHNNFSHSLAAGALAALLAGAVAALAGASSARAWAAWTLLCWWAHLAMDYVTVGRGVMLLWPFTTERLSSPVKLFYGLRWSAGVASSHHLVTAVSEALLIAAVLLLLRRAALGGCGNMTGRRPS